MFNYYIILTPSYLRVEDNIDNMNWEENAGNLIARVSSNGTKFRIYNKKGLEEVLKEDLLDGDKRVFKISKIKSKKRSKRTKNAFHCESFTLGKMLNTNDLDKIKNYNKVVMEETTSMTN